MPSSQPARCFPFYFADSRGFLTGKLPSRDRGNCWKPCVTTAPAVVDELLRSGLENPLATKRLMVTTLIADLEGYTTQVEQLSTEAAAQLTRDFGLFDAAGVEPCGTLDK
jgi:hypothetical protein